MNDGNAPYQYRRCLDHFHVTCGDMDLIGGKFATEEEAKNAAFWLNNGAQTARVLVGLDAAPRRDT